MALSRLQRGIRRLRRQRKLTQAEVAQRCGQHVTTVSKWEIGASTPRPQTLERLAKVLGTTIADLYGERAA